jgi:hypothetical protein
MSCEFRLLRSLPEYLHVLKLAAEQTLEKVQSVLEEKLKRPGKWHAKTVREQLVPPGQKVIELSALTPQPCGLR